MQTVRNTWWDLLKAGWRLWPFVHIVTYGLLPVQHRLLFVDSVELVRGWQGAALHRLGVPFAPLCLPWWLVIGLHGCAQCGWPPCPLPPPAPPPNTLSAIALSVRLQVWVTILSLYGQQQRRALAAHGAVGPVACALPGGDGEGGDPVEEILRGIQVRSTQRSGEALSRCTRIRDNTHAGPCSWASAGACCCWPGGGHILPLTSVACFCYRPSTLPSFSPQAG